MRLLIGLGSRCMSIVRGVRGSKQRNHIISFEPISERSASSSFHVLSTTFVSIDVIHEFWQARKRKLHRIV